jgi:cell wall assembly regulator SMI1
MQKFTRTLTREIEVGGERLALSLDEKGLSVRPVGGRKAPHSMTWTTLACVLTGKAPAGDNPTDQEIAAALKTLRAGSSVAPESSPARGERSTASPAAGDLKSLFARLDRWLANHRSGYHQGLASGATAEQLAGLEEALGMKLPAELRTLLEWHNGQTPDLVGAFRESFRLLGTEEIAQEYRDQVGRHGDLWDKGWIPFLADDQGDFVCVDVGQKGEPVPEIWRGRHTSDMVAPSLTAWVQTFIEEVEAGRYHEDSERGEFIRAS